MTKCFATSATNGAGGVGGTFAPSLYVGCMTGFLFAFVANMMGFDTVLSTKNFALIGMAGVMSGVMHAPLMAIFLTAELTGGYDLFLPLHGAHQHLDLHLFVEVHQGAAVQGAVRGQLDFHDLHPALGEGIPPQERGEL